jgi:glycosyltransferase involved in cell wall biosynthesis
MCVEILVSVVIPTYNSARTLAKCLSSVERQTLKDYEVIIVDGLSRDETKSIARKIAERNPAFKYIETRYKFQAPKRSIGIKASKGKYIFFLDSDQYMMPRLLEKAVEYAERESVEALKIPEFPLYKPSAVARAENIIKYPTGFRVVHYRLFQRDVFTRAGLMDPNIPYVEDLEFYLRMELAKVKLGIMPLMKEAYLLHDESISFRSITLKRYYIGVGTARTYHKFSSHFELFNKYFSSGFQQRAKLQSKYRLFINRARKDPKTLPLLMLLIPIRAIAMRIGYYTEILSREFPL